LPYWIWNKLGEMALAIHRSAGFVTRLQQWAALPFPALANPVIFEGARGSVEGARGSVEGARDSVEKDECGEH